MRQISDENFFEVAQTLRETYQLLILHRQPTGHIIGMSQISFEEIIGKIEKISKLLGTKNANENRSNKDIPAS